MHLWIGIAYKSSLFALWKKSEELSKKWEQDLQFWGAACQSQLNIIFDSENGVKWVNCKTKFNPQLILSQSTMLN